MVQNFTKKHYNNIKSQGSNKQVPLVVGLIYANWCSHCKALEPEWKKLKESLSKNKQFKKKGGDIFEVEDSDPQKQEKMISVHPNLQANGYPTLFKIVGGNIEYYNGERNAQSLEKWVIESSYKNKKVNNSGGENKNESKEKEKEKEYEDRQLQNIGFFNSIFGGYIFKKPSSKTIKRNKTMKSKTPLYMKKSNRKSISK